MKQFFVNLKRFDISKDLGGICPVADPFKWIESIMEETAKSEFLFSHDISITFLLPEALLFPANLRLKALSSQLSNRINIGSQGVFREDVSTGVNFGAFTTNKPASSQKNLGAEWTIIGHSEERKDKLGIISCYDPDLFDNISRLKRAKSSIDVLVKEEIHAALNKNLKVLFCIGETEIEKGSGTFQEQSARIAKTLNTQILTGLQGITSKCIQNDIVIAYEPIWAIGPGKPVPNNEHISFVTSHIKGIVREKFGCSVGVVYGGGLKEENASSIAQIDSLDGGLIALTRFTGEIAFEAQGMKQIIINYLSK